MFVIEEKIPHPDWYPKPGVKIPYGDPENILGTRWMAFRNTAEYRGFGIHGTADPTSIGKAMSSGCIRMRRADVERLFDWTPIGMKVTIRR
jgi:lipoprotein-anchoring transpeptidase ErfK/SrfK